MTKEQLFGLIRHALTLGAGYLTSVGVGTEELWLSVVSGILAAIGIAWSFYSPEKPKTPATGKSKLPLLIVAFAAIVFLPACNNWQSKVGEFKSDHPVVYDAGSTFIKVALNSAFNTFLQKNPNYSPYIDGLGEILIGTTVPQAKAIIAERIPDPNDRQEFAELLAQEINMDAPASSTADLVWLVDLTESL